MTGAGRASIRRRGDEVLGGAFAVALLAILPALPVVAAEESVGPPSRERLSIVDRSIEHHGGEAYRSSVIRLALCSKSGCSDIRSTVDGDAFDLEVTGEVRDGERRARITNETVEEWLDGEAVAIDGDRGQGIRDWVMARVYFAFLPYRLNDPSVLKRDLDLERWGDRTLHRVGVSFVPGSSTDAEDAFVYWFDPDSGRVEQFAYSYTRGDGGLRFRRAFNYRRVGGILFFDQENLGIDGPGFSVEEIDPDFVSQRLRSVSIVELRQVRVGPLP